MRYYKVSVRSCTVGTQCKGVLKYEVSEIRMNHIQKGLQYHTKEFDIVWQWGITAEFQKEK